MAGYIEEKWTISSKIHFSDFLLCFCENSRSLKMRHLYPKCNQQFINILFLPTLIRQVVIGLSDSLYQLPMDGVKVIDFKEFPLMAQSSDLFLRGVGNCGYWLTMTLFCDKLLCHMLLSFYLWNFVFGLGAELILKAGNISPQCDWFSCYPESAINVQEVVKTPTPTIHVNDHFPL